MCVVHEKLYKKLCFKNLESYLALIMISFFGNAIKLGIFFCIWFLSGHKKDKRLTIVTAKHVRQDIN